MQPAAAARSRRPSRLPPALRAAARPRPTCAPRASPRPSSTPQLRLRRLADRRCDPAAARGGGGYAPTRPTSRSRGRGRGGAAAPPTPPARRPPAEPPRKSVRDMVGRISRDQAHARGDAGQGHATSPKAGDIGAAFLVFRRAAEAGNAPAQLELATFYDPLTSPPKGGFTPDGARAADWYERAALAGLAEAQRKLGLLLAKGGAGLAADHGQGQDLAAAGGGAERRRRQEGAGGPAQVRRLAGAIARDCRVRPQHSHQTATLTCGSFKAECRRTAVTRSGRSPRRRRRRRKTACCASGPASNASRTRR